MTYHSFIGIDIGKHEFVTAVKDKKKAETFLNTEIGWSRFFKSYHVELRQALVVLETTGGYEQGILSFLVDRGITVHRADTRKVKSFMRSYGHKAKTDKIDAFGLAAYASERHSSLKLYESKESQQNKLKLLEERRQDLKQILVQEKNRVQAPLNQGVLEYITPVIDCLETQLASISEEIEKIIKSNQVLQKKEEVLLSVPGIGKITAQSLLALLPELGHLDRKQIASLCGLAPHPKQSGTRTFYSRTSGGRTNLKPVLFMAAMGARRSKTTLRAFYEKLIESGKKKMVALTALMRKIIVIANARLRDEIIKNNEPNTLQPS